MVTRVQIGQYKQRIYHLMIDAVYDARILTENGKITHSEGLSHFAAILATVKNWLLSKSNVLFRKYDLVSS